MRVLDKLKQLEPVQFKYIQSLDPATKLRAGFIAQQVQKIIPEAVVEIDGVLHLDLIVLRSYYYQAKQELKQQNTNKLWQ